MAEENARQRAVGEDAGAVAGARGVREKEGKDMKIEGELNGEVVW